jgi:MSHA biogenesis protein MshJ
MNSTLARYAEMFDSRNQRERVLLAATLVVAVLFAWLWLVGQPVFQQIEQLEQNNAGLQAEVDRLDLTAQTLEQEISAGVHRTKEEQLERLQVTLQMIEEELKQKAFDLIGPDEMFGLMGEMLFRESRLRLTSLKRKQVGPVFSVDEGIDQPNIYRHVMSVGFTGKFPDVVSYIDRLEHLDWKLIWDSISLTTVEYPKIQVEIEISTLSDSPQWVGL